MSAFWLQRQGCDAADLTLVKRHHMGRQECCDARRGKMTRQLEAKKVEVALSQRGDAPGFFERKTCIEWKVRIEWKKADGVGFEPLPYSAEKGGIADKAGAECGAGDVTDVDLRRVVASWARLDKAAKQKILRILDDQARRIPP